MNNALFQQIHKYAEDREIDYISAKVIGEQHGIVWKSEGQLVEFKQVVDNYLKTFEDKNFQLIEMKIKALSGKNTRTTEEAEEMTHYAATEKQMRKPHSKQNVYEEEWWRQGQEEEIKALLLINPSL
jgi:hypothetical protein